MGKSKDYPDATDYSNPEIRLIGNDANKLQKNYKLLDIAQSIYDQFTVDLGGQSITSQDITNWNTAYGWGDWSTQGFALDSGVMHLDGVETATGFKTFSAGLGTDNSGGTARFGYGAAMSAPTGDKQAYTSVGNYSGASQTTSINWTAIGYSSGHNNIDGTNWTSIGDISGNNNVHGSFWVANGYAAGSVLSVSGSPATSFDNSVYVGANTTVSANGVTNENVFGYYAGGLGSNSISLGNSNITKLGIGGTEMFYSPLLSGNAGTAGYVLTSNGASVAPSWQPMSGSGTGAEYTATFSGLTNITSIQSHTAEYIKTGKVIKVHMSVYAIVAASGLCKYTITLPTADVPKYWDDPVGSVTVVEAADTAWALGSITMISNTQAEVSWIATSTGVGGSTMSVDFMYVIN